MPGILATAEIVTGSDSQVVQQSSPAEGPVLTKVLDPRVTRTRGLEWFHASPGVLHELRRFLERYQHGGTFAYTPPGEAAGRWMVDDGSQGEGHSTAVAGSFSVRIREVFATQ